MSLLRALGDQKGQANGEAQQQGQVLHVKQIWKMSTATRILLYCSCFHCLALILNFIALSSFKGMIHHPFRGPNVSFIWI